MRSVISVLLGAMFGYIAVCAGVVLFYQPSLRAHSPEEWWREQLTTGGLSPELFGLVGCIALAGYVHSTLFSGVPVPKSLIAMALAVVGALHYPLGDLRRPDLALLAQWHLSAPFIVGPAVAVFLFGEKDINDDASRRRFYRLDPWLRKLGYFRKK
jgi:membrane associated rhomboid family serine protease